MAKNILVTGRPGIGKTTLVLRVIELLKKEGVRVGGMISKEEREGGIRVGFVVEDVATGARGYLARVGYRGGIRVGKYVVVLEDLESVGVRAIRNALKDSDVVVIDEIGPMELYSRMFREAVVEALESPKPVLATIHMKAETFPFTRDLLRRNDIELITLTIANREVLPGKLASKILTILRGED